MRREAFIITLLLALALCSTALAQSGDAAEPGPVVLSDEQEKYPLGQHLEILEDPSGELTIEEITSPEFAAQFVPSEVDVPNFGLTDSAYWVRLPLRNETRLIDRWLLEVGFPNMHFVDLYTPLPDGDGFSVKQTGVLRPLATRDIRHPRIVLDLSVPPQSEQIYYLRFQNGASMTLPLTLWMPASFFMRSQLEHLMRGLFFGALLVLLAYNLFLLFMLREKSYLYMTFVLVSMILLELAYTGYSDAYLFPALYFLKRYSLGLSFSLLMISLVLFTDALLELKKQSPRLHWLNMAIVAVWAVLMLLILTPFLTYHQLVVLVTPFGVVSLAAIIAVMILAWQKGSRPALLLLVSGLGLVGSLIVVILIRLGAIPSTIVSENAYLLGLVVMAVCWSMALADRVNVLKTETEVANRNLRSSEFRMSQILEGLPIGVVVYERDSRPSYFNRRVLEILSNPQLGLKPDLDGRRTIAQSIEYFSLCVTGSDQAYPLEDMPAYRALHHGQRAYVDNIEANLGGNRVPLEIWASPVKIDSGDVESALVAFQDISQRSEAEAELAEYRNHLESLVEQRTAELSAVNALLKVEATDRTFLAEIQAKQILWLSTINEISHELGGEADLPQAHENLLVAISQLLGAKSAFIGLWDYRREQINILSCLQPNDSPTLTKQIPISPDTESSMTRIVEQGQLLISPADTCCEILESLGMYFEDEEILSGVLAPIGIKGGVVGLLGVGMPRLAESFSDEEVKLFERIEFDLANLTEYARFYDTAREIAASEERNRLARDLHDSVTQALFSASLISEVVPRIWRRDPAQALDSLEELRRLTRGALAEMRTMLLTLRPDSVIKISLPELLAQLTEAVTSRSDLSVDLSIEQIPALPEDVHICFYRIAQEALNNLVKHARADRVGVSLSVASHAYTSNDGSSQAVTLEISDDGVGFTSGSRRPEQMGIGIMRERAAAIGAGISIESDPGRGTQVTLTWSSK